MGQYQKLHVGLFSNVGKCFQKLTSNYASCLVMATPQNINSTNASNR